VIDLPETCFAEVHPSWEFYLSKLFLEKVCWWGFSFVRPILDLLWGALKISFDESYVAEPDAYCRAECLFWIIFLSTLYCSAISYFVSTFERLKEWGSYLRSFEVWLISMKEGCCNYSTLFSSISSIFNSA
jgi:hypothetical protein